MAWLTPRTQVDVGDLGAHRFEQADLVGDCFQLGQLDARTARSQAANKPFRPRTIIRIGTTNRPRHDLGHV